MKREKTGTGAPGSQSPDIGPEGTRLPEVNPLTAEWAKIVHYREADGAPPACSASTPGKYTRAGSEVTCHKCKRKIGVK